jgi:hypothetical protein
VQPQPLSQDAARSVATYRTAVSFNAQSDPARGRDRPRHADSEPEVIEPAGPLPPLSPIDRRSLDYSGLEAAMDGGHGLDGSPIPKSAGWVPICIEIDPDRQDTDLLRVAWNTVLSIERTTSTMPTPQ